MLSMKRLLILLFCLPLFVLAQKPSYKIHKVAPKESFTSIGRLYNINGRELANYNHLEYEKGLSIGQEIKIPNTANAASPAPVIIQETKKEPVVKPQIKSEEKAGEPIYHIVGKKETLYHISTLYNKVPIADLKKWNNLTTDGLSEGAKLIVGYSKSGTKPAQKKTEPVIVKETPKEVVAEPVTKKEVVKEIIKEESVKEVVVPKQNNHDGGFFKSIFSTQPKNGDFINQTGSADIFKSTSGWEDGKYYCLHNAAGPGSIAKITSTLTGKSIYAKVLDVIPDIKQNADLVLRLSNAAAAELGVGDTKFECSIIYIK
jgi:LysM repeat protein